uniref:ANK_REP_REGION domain-containing protein n=1 Tax=Heterorhabditis bacteriophora TaxID=37862 RepID=A0A1I7X108_HETBA
MNLSPLLNLLRPESMTRMAEIASQLSSLAAHSVAKNERDVLKSAEPREVPVSSNIRPSEVLGQSFSNIALQSRTALLEALDPLQSQQPDGQAATTIHVEQSVTTKPTTTKIGNDTVQSSINTKNFVPFRSEHIDVKDENVQETAPSSASDIRLSPTTINNDKILAQSIRPIVDTQAVRSLETVSNQNPDDVPRPVIEHTSSSLEQNPFFRLASSFLKGLPEFDIKHIVKGADSNFGIPKGKGCLPFLTEFMQVAYGNCQQVADEKAFDAWGSELKSAILTGQIDLLRARIKEKEVQIKASQETCRRGAERETCGALRQAIATCDILASLQIGSQLQRAMKRCDEVSGLVDQAAHSPILREFMSHLAILLVMGIMLTYPFLLNGSLAVINNERGEQVNLITFFMLYSQSRASRSTTPLTQVTTATVRPYNSIQEEIEYLRKAYDNLRKDFDNWMLSPYHRTVVLPALIGVATAFLTLSFICCLRFTWNRCKRYASKSSRHVSYIYINILTLRSCRRDRISHSTRELNGDKKRMLPKNTDSDDEF